MDKVSELLLHVGVVTVLSGIAFSSCAASDVNNKDLFSCLNPSEQAEVKPVNTGGGKLSRYLARVSYGIERHLSDGMTPFVYKKHEDGSWEDIWGNQYPIGCRIEQNRIVYPDGKWISTDYRMVYNADDYTGTPLTGQFLKRSLISSVDPCSNDTVVLNICGSEVRFNKNNPEECFHVLEKVCNEPHELKNDSYVFPLAGKALSHNKDKVIEMVTDYFLRIHHKKRGLELLGLDMFTRKLDYADKMGFWLDLGDREAADDEIASIRFRRSVDDKEVFGSGIVESAAPKTRNGQELKAVLLEYYRVMAH